tara:strand:+ start:4739 stop:4972 length:234 start_codon:yes stop_codon:yes gene_type:complete
VDRDQLKLTRQVQNAFNRYVEERMQSATADAEIDALQWAKVNLGMIISNLVRLEEQKQKAVNNGTQCTDTDPKAIQS